MKRVFNCTKISILMSTFILVVVCSPFVENRTPSPRSQANHSQRKPPFNGSIFGKRSSLPPTIGPVYEGSSTELQQDNINYQLRRALGALAYLSQQQEDALKSAINQCLAQQRVSSDETEQQQQQKEQQEVISTIWNDLVGQQTSGGLAADAAAANWLSGLQQGDA